MPLLSLRFYHSQTTSYFLGQTETNDYENVGEEHEKIPSASSASICFVNIKQK